MKYGNLFSSEHLSIKAVRGKAPVSEVRVVVSKKVAKNAVLRNRLKRRIQSIFKEVNPKSSQVIFYTKAGSSELPFRDLQREVKYLLEKIK